MKFSPTKISGVVVIELERRSDERGFFARQWCADELAKAGLDANVSQINTSHSIAKGTLRGVHFQNHPHAEVKIVRCVRGAVFDVAVDLRPASPTFRQWIGLELDAENGRMLYIPKGCGHGFITLSPDTDLVYQASVPYAGSSASGVRYDDPAFAIAWPGKVEVISDQDRSWPLFEVGTAATAR
jgi:dTDP-4-dehydrorhamnose 3,5-epimerase